MNAYWSNNNLKYSNSSRTYRSWSFGTREFSYTLPRRSDGSEEKTVIDIFFKEELKLPIVQEKLRKFASDNFHIRHIGKSDEKIT